ncbi:MAG: YfhO family protein [Caldilineaceae bacterium]
MRRSHLTHTLAALVLALFVALLYARLLFTNRVLASGDILLYFYPYRDYAAAALRSGQISLWNPYIFMGAPFLANPQAAVLYPLHWPLSWLPVTQQIYWSAALHTWLLGYGGYWLARRYALGAWAGLGVGLVLAGSGFYGGLVGHINQMNAAAWLPWALLLFRISDLSFTERAGATRVAWGNVLGSMVWFGLLVALMILAGHTQSAYINLFGIGLWLVGAALLDLPSYRLSSENLRRLVTTLAPPLLSYGGGVMLGVLLCAAQLLPTLELSSLGLRSGGLSYLEATSFSLRPLRLPWSLLPTYGLSDLGVIFGVGYSEFVAYVGLVGLLLAAIGAWQGRGPARQMGLFFALLGLLLALGRWNPLYYLLYRLAPGFDLFRVPARWLMLYTLGMALLAGVGLESIGRGVVGSRSRGVAGSPSHPVIRSSSHLVILLLLATDLLLAARALPHTQPTAPQAVYDVRTAPAHLLTDPARTRLGDGGVGRFLAMSTIAYDPGDMADWRRVFRESDPPQLDERAFAQFIIALKLQELSVPNLPLLWRIPAVDGFDGGVLPLQRYNQLLTLFVPPDQLVPDGRLREQIKEIPNTDLLGLLNVQYVITDKVRDLWFDDVYYDRQIGARLNQTRPLVQVAAPQLFEATHIDLIGTVEGDPNFLHGAQLPVLQVTPVTEAGLSMPITVTAGDQPGSQLADGTLESPNAQQSGAVVAWRDVENQRQEYRVRLPLTTPATVTGVQLQWLDPPLAVQVQAITLYDARAKMFVPLLPSDRGHFRLVHSGDVKIYENLDLRPRAYLVHEVHGVSDTAAALARLQDDVAIQAGAAAVVEGDLTLATTPAAEDRAELLHYAPEEVVIRTHSQNAALLVLSDSFYPGWQATVDGAPTPLYATNVLFRGVAVPAGEHTVTMRFAPASWDWGVRISGVGIVLWLLLLGLSWRWQRAF